MSSRSRAAVDRQPLEPVLEPVAVSQLGALVERRSGLVFAGEREAFLRERLLRHLQEQRLASAADLLRRVHESNAAYDALLECLLTRETSFFRYPAVFAVLETKILPELHMLKFWEKPRTLRLWSAGCATGEEPYSIAITVADSLGLSDSWNVHLLATDVSREALRHAERGVYAPRQLAGVNPRQLETYFARVGDQFMIKPRIRNMVSFALMNLAQMVYAGRFDCIFCMNVLMYLSAERRLYLLQRFYEYLEPGGYLFLGHAETAAGSPLPFERVVHGDALVYQKPLGGHRRAPAQEKM